MVRVAKVVDLAIVRRARGLDDAKPRGLVPSEDLSFVKRRKGGRTDYWAVKSTGSLTADFKAGQKLADEYLAYIGEYRSDLHVTLLCSIVRSMCANTPAGEKWSGVQIAFLNRVNRYAMAAAAVIEMGEE